MGIDFNGVNGNTPLFGTNKTNSTDDVKKQQKIDFGFNFSTNEIGDSFGTKKTTLLEQMMEIAAKGDVKLPKDIDDRINRNLKEVYANEELADEFFNNGIPVDPSILKLANDVRKALTNPLA